MKKSFEIAKFHVSDFTATPDSVAIMSSDAEGDNLEEVAQQYADALTESDPDIDVYYESFAILTEEDYVEIAEKLRKYYFND